MLENIPYIDPHAAHCQRNVLSRGPHVPIVGLVRTQTNHPVNGVSVSACPRPHTKRRKNPKLKTRVLAEIPGFCHVLCAKSQLFSAPNPECTTDPECPDHLACVREKCQDPCQSHSCGINAECESSGGRAICKCPRGFTGDPFTRCDDNPCNSDPCGSNADCENAGNRAVCRCRDGYEGNFFEFFEV